MAATPSPPRLAPEGRFQANIGQKASCPRWGLWHQNTLRADPPADRLAYRRLHLLFVLLAGLAVAGWFADPWFAGLA